MSANSNEKYTPDNKNDFEQNKTFLSSSSEYTDFFERSSSNKSTYNTLHKRKLSDEADSVGDGHKKTTFDISFCVSPWEFRRLKADLMESQAQRIRLEDRIDQLHKKNKEAVIFFDREKNEMKGQLESNRNTIKDLEFRLNKVRKREIEFREELNKKTKDFELLKLDFREKILFLETENRELKLKVSQLESDSNETIFSLNKNLENLKTEIQKFDLQLCEKEEICSNLNAKITNLTENENKYEEMKNQLFLARLKIKDLQKEIDDFKEAKNITMILSEKALRVSELEKELSEHKSQVAYLKQFLHHNIILEEMVQDLKTKLSVHKDNENELPNLRAKIVELESELENWVMVASDFSNDSTRNSLRNYIETLQKKELTCSLEINALNGVIRASENKLSSLQNALENSKNQNEKLQGLLRKLKVEVQMLRKKSVLVSRERDSYRQQLDLYEKDLTFTGFPVENQPSDATSQMKSRIHDLETFLEEYRKRVETLEKQLKDYHSEEPFESADKNYKLQEEIKKLEESNRLLTKVKDQLEQKLEILALKGEYICSDTKILHLRNNPVFEAEKKQEKDFRDLKEECSKLRARVKLLESGEVLNITQRVSEDIRLGSTQKNAELEKELQSANIKMQRLKEVFKKTSQEFRDVSYMLLGYRIDLASNSKLYKLYNMYSTSPSDYLMFQQTKKATLEMLGTTFAESLSTLVDKYLHKGNSIPAFLSAVTLKLYESTVLSDSDDNIEDNDENDNILENDNNDDDDNKNNFEDNMTDAENRCKNSGAKNTSMEPIELD